MGIRPYVAIHQTLGNSAANIASSTMKGMLVGPCIQSEQDFSSITNLSSSYGTVASILSDVSTEKKIFNVAGLSAGSKVIPGSIRFGIENAVTVLDFNGKNYGGNIKTDGEKFIVKIDLTTLTIEDVLSSGAENGDELLVSYDDGVEIKTETHKVRSYEVVSGELFVHLWDEIAYASITTATNLSLVQRKVIDFVDVEVMSPMTAEDYGASANSFTMDNTSSPEDGGFTAKLYVYSPIGSPDGVTFDNREVSSVKLTTMSSHSVQEKTLKVVDGTLHNLFKANRSDLSNNIFEVTSEDYEAKLGSPTMDNKLSYAMSLISKEVPGATMKVYVTEDDGIEAYQRAFGAISTSDLAYTVSILTDRPDVISAFSEMIKLAATPAVAKWKMGILAPRTPHYTQALNLNSYSVGVGSSAGLFEITSDNGGFLSSGVNAGDIIISESKMEIAEESYYGSYSETYSPNSSAKVVSIVTDKKIIVSVENGVTNLVDDLSGNSISIGSINQFNELSEKIKSDAQNDDSKNITRIFPDKCDVETDDGVVLLPSYYAAAVINGALAHLPPQQGISNMSLSSIKRVVGSSFTFTDGELDEIASSGVMVLLQKDNSSSPYILRQLTTNNDSLEAMEINKARCLDYATLEFAKSIDGYIGKRNISETNALDLKDELEVVGNTMKTTTNIAGLGSVVTDFTIGDVYIPDSEKDAIVAIIDVTTPTSLNKIRLFVTSGE